MKTSIVILVACLAAGCVKQEVVDNPAVSAGVGPTLVVEEFMRAVRATPKDLATMGRLFGTAEGPIAERDERANVEQRMYAIATVLNHDDFEVLSQQIVPGRTQEATRLQVRVQQRGASNVVPFLLVRYKEGWVIEEIGLDVITNPR